jgi:hypothetical protein
MQWFIRFVCKLVDDGRSNFWTGILDGMVRDHPYRARIGLPEGHAGSCEVVRRLGVDTDINDMVDVDIPCWYRVMEHTARGDDWSMEFLVEVDVLRDYQASRGGAPKQPTGGVQRETDEDAAAATLDDILRSEDCGLGDARFISANVDLGLAGAAENAVAFQRGLPIEVKVVRAAYGHFTTFAPTPSPPFYWGKCLSAAIDADRANGSAGVSLTAGQMASFHRNRTCVCGSDAFTVKGERVLSGGEVYELPGLVWGADWQSGPNM